MGTFELLNALAMLELSDGVIGFPTETTYEIGCYWDKPEALQKLRALKEWQTPRPLSLIGRSPEQVMEFVEHLTPEARRQACELMERYWPGSLVIVLPKSDILAESLLGGYSTVALRVPDCPILQDLLALTPSKVLAASSANRAWDPPCLRGEEVARIFGSALDYILVDDFSILDKQEPTMVEVNPDGSLQVLRIGRIVLD